MHSIVLYPIAYLGAVLPPQGHLATLGTVLVASLGERDRLLWASGGKRPVLPNVLLRVGPRLRPQEENIRSAEVAKFCSLLSLIECDSKSAHFKSAC